MPDWTFRPEISGGEVVTIAITLAIALVSVLAWSRKVYRAHFPFKAEYADQDAHYSGPRTFSSVGQLRVGEMKEFFVWLWPVVPVSCSVATIRCVERDWRSWGLAFGDADPNVVAVVIAGDYREEAGFVRDRVDTPGGIELRYQELRHWPVRGAVQLLVTVTASQEWSGKLSVCNEFGGTHRQYARLPLRVVP